MLTGRFTFELLVSWLRRKESTAAKPEMRNLYNFLREYPSTVKDYKEKFRCTICDSNISLAHSGQGDIEKHKETKAHKDNVKSAERTLMFFHRPTQ